MHHSGQIRCAHWKRTGMFEPSIHGRSMVIQKSKTAFVSCVAQGCKRTKRPSQGSSLAGITSLSLFYGFASGARFNPGPRHAFRSPRPSWRHTFRFWGKQWSKFPDNGKRASSVLFLSKDCFFPLIFISGERVYAFLKKKVLFYKLEGIHILHHNGSTTITSTDVWNNRSI